MRPQRRLPPWRRLVLEYIAMFLSFMAVISIGGHPILALVVMIAVMFVLRATRPKTGGSGDGGKR